MATLTGATVLVFIVAAFAVGCGSSPSADSNLGSASTSPAAPVRLAAGAATQFTPETEGEANQRAAERCQALEAAAGRARCVGERQGGASCAGNNDASRAGDIAFRKWDGSAAYVYRCGAAESGATSWLVADTYLTPGMAGANVDALRSCERSGRCRGEQKERALCFENSTVAYEFTRVPGGEAKLLSCYIAFTVPGRPIVVQWEVTKEFGYRAVPLPTPAPDPPAESAPAGAPPAVQQQPSGAESGAAAPGPAPAPAPTPGAADAASAPVAALAGMRATRSRAGLTLTLRQASPEALVITAGAVTCRISTGARACTLRGGAASRAQAIKVAAGAEVIPYSLPPCTPKRVTGKKIPVCVVAAK